ncbi:MAG: RdgB/HAM1 family non-canonical purine NTP pyrophosphatase [Alphaproteobacteria bacterium]|nr:RdgB/HAM1 family non-canonical purine NTP pyrophosphatase [Alphaproteobacteria bacterium]MCZ6763502.1 RdgB/HAM1 family non-canonical purine NTP pyrophosphatase [Alphaproteobacteria bacterium]
MTPLVDTGLVIATHNPGKVAEIAELVEPFGIEVHSAIEMGLEEPDESGLTFEANALIKARAAATGAGLPALADDSGLTVDVLKGAPGIYSSRLAGPDKDFAVAMERVKGMAEEQGATLHEIAQGTSPTAKFICVLALAMPDGEAQIFTGEVAGALVWPPRGANGFGYDPIFQPFGEELTFGEMDRDAKHAISHRADAFRKLTQVFFDGEDE